MFQASHSMSLMIGSPSYVEMIRYVKSNLAKLEPGMPLARSLVVGSNIMADFFNSVRSWLQMPIRLEISIEELKQVSAAIIGRDYSQLGAAFPTNPKFMYGADKLLIVVVEAVKIIRPERVIPTNESVSKGIARLAMRAPERLADYGLLASTFQAR
jgi:hypothetical protein